MEHLFDSWVFFFKVGAATVRFEVPCKGNESRSIDEVARELVRRHWYPQLRQPETWSAYGKGKLVLIPLTGEDEIFPDDQDLWPDALNLY